MVRGGEAKMCFARKRKINMNHYIRECEIAMDWLKILDNNEEERIKRIRNDSLGREKENVII